MKFIVRWNLYRVELFEMSNYTMHIDKKKKLNREQQLFLWPYFARKFPDLVHIRKTEILTLLEVKWSIVLTEVTNMREHRRSYELPFSISNYCNIVSRVSRGLNTVIDSIVLRFSVNNNERTVCRFINLYDAFIFH